MTQHRVKMGDLVSLDGSVYGAAAGVVIEELGVDVRVLYTEEDGSVRRIRRRADSLVVVRKQNEKQ